MSVTILMPSYNHARFIEESIRSVWEQSHPEVELIVHDDVSCDNSWDVIQKLQRQSPIPMLISRGEKNGGISRALNRCLARASGDWIGVLSSDDRYHPDKLAKQLRALEGTTHGLVHCDAIEVDQDGKERGRIFKRSHVSPASGECFLDFALARSRILATSYLVRRDLLNSCGGYDEDLPAEDFDFYLRISRLTTVLYVDEPLVFVRASPGSLGRQPTLIQDSVLAAIEKHRDILAPRMNEILAVRWSEILRGHAHHGPLGQGALALRKSLTYAAKARTLGNIAPRCAWFASRGMAYRARNRLRRLA